MDDGVLPSEKTELEAVEYEALCRNVVEVLKKLDVPLLGTPCYSLADRDDAKVLFAGAVKDLNDPIAKLAKAEQCLKRRKVVCQQAVNEVGDFKKGALNILKLLNSLASGKGDCESQFAAINASVAKNIWDPPLAVLVALTQSIAVERVRSSDLKTRRQVTDRQTGTGLQRSTVGYSMSARCF